ncbi:cytochrome P450 [Mycena galericulata]|nr:cytochrome P450 [Mycena galericulata]
MDHLDLLALIVSLTLLFDLLRRWKVNRTGLRLPFPPGPAPQFVIGNLREMPTKRPWLTYTEWGSRYGDLVHARTLGEHIFIVNSSKTASELFDKRSHIYSDRPVVPFVDMSGWDFNLAFMPYGEKWRRYRRLMQQHFRRDISRNYQPI